MEGDWRNPGSPGHCFISHPYKGLSCYIHLSEARQNFKTSNWRLVLLSWGTLQFKSWAGRESGLKARQRDEREERDLASELAWWCLNILKAELLQFGSSLLKIKQLVFMLGSKTHRSCGISLLAEKSWSHCKILILLWLWMQQHWFHTELTRQNIWCRKNSYLWEPPQKRVRLAIATWFLDNFLILMMSNSQRLKSEFEAIAAGGFCV